MENFKNQVLTGDDLKTVNGGNSHYNSYVYSHYYQVYQSNGTCANYNLMINAYNTWQGTNHANANCGGGGASGAQGPS